MLRELGEGAEINRVLEKHTAPLATLEKEFAAYGREQAARMAPGLDFEKPSSASRGTAAGDSAWTDWAKTRPTNFWALTRRASKLAEDKNWAEAKPILEQLIRLYPGFTGRECAYALLAEAHRALGETNAEREVLVQWADRDDEALEAYQRLMELGAGAGDWPCVQQNARRYLAVDPLVPLPYRFLARAGEAQGRLPVAIEAQRALLQLDPPNPAEVHYDLARLMHRAGEAGARRQVLQALEEAPRYRAALALLLQMGGQAPETNAPAKTAEAQP
jgi:tetratricopeptide (TPR) repeat protein